MAMTNIKVSQMACIETGLNPISTMTDDTAEGKAITAHYDTIVANNLSLHYWRFACAQVELNLLLSTPAGRWGYAFQIPSSVLVIRAVTIAGFPIPFERYDDMIYCDADGTSPVVLDGIFDTPEAKWPAYFTRLVVLHLAAILASGVRENAEMRKQLDEEAVMQFRLAKNRDSSSRTTSRMKPTRITNSRLARGGNG